MSVRENRNTSYNLERQFVTKLGKLACASNKSYLIRNTLVTISVSVCSCLQMGLKIRVPLTVREQGRSFQLLVPVAGLISSSTQSSLPALLGSPGDQFVNNRVTPFKKKTSPDNHW